MTAADRIAEARALIEPLTGYSRGPWVSQHRGTRRDIERREDYHRVTTQLEADDPNAIAIVCVHWRLNRAENARLIAAAPALRDTVAALADLADAQAQEIERLRKVLGFYANPENWKGDEEAWERAENGDDDPETLEALLSTVELDGGKIARAALGETP